VTFTIVDRDGGAAITGATIVVRDGEAILGEGTTDADGKATLSVALAGVSDPIATVTKSGFSIEAHALRP